jgi:hypothetical protein
MSSPSAENVIALRIRVILARSADVSPGVVRFIDSTFSDPSADELADILGAENDSERDSLLELLFTPDESVQLELEHLLATKASLGLNEDRVVELLCRPAPSVGFRLPEKRGAVKVAMTPLLARRFVHQLNLNRLIPEPLAAAIEARLAGRDRLRLRVQLRNARFDFVPFKTDFICRLIEHLSFEDENAWESFAFALDLLAGTAPAADIGDTLMERKKLLVKALQHSRQLREQLATSNIETLLSRGQRLTWVDEAAVRRQLECVDRICLAAFGRIAHLDPGGPDETVAFGGLPDITDFMRRLT